MEQAPANFGQKVQSFGKLPLLGSVMVGPYSFHLLILDLMVLCGMVNVLRYITLKLILKVACSMSLTYVDVHLCILLSSVCHLHKHFVASELNDRICYSPAIKKVSETPVWRN